MAEGAWVPCYDSLWSSQKTALAAKELRLPIDVVAAKFLRLMAWMRDHAPSGDLGPMDRAAVARAVGMAAEKDPDELAAKRGEALYGALLSAGFLLDKEAGHVKGWEDGPGKLVARRGDDRLRKEHDRNGHQRPVPGCPKCRRLSNGNERELSTNPATRANLSIGQPTPVHRTSIGQRSLSDRREEREERQEGAPTPNRARDGRRVSDGQPADEGAWHVAEIIAGTSGLWHDALTALSRTVGPRNFVAWFFRTRLEQRPGVWAVVVPNAYARQWLEEHYAIAVREALPMTSETELRFVLEAGLLQLPPAEDAS